MECRYFYVPLPGLMYVVRVRFDLAGFLLKKPESDPFGVDPGATVLERADVPVATGRLIVESNLTQRGVLLVDYYAAATGGSHSRF
jgi:hypothetical protein